MTGKPNGGQYEILNNDILMKLLFTEIKALQAFKSCFLLLYPLIIFQVSLTHFDF